MLVVEQHHVSRRGNRTPDQSGAPPAERHVLRHGARDAMENWQFPTCLGAVPLNRYEQVDTATLSLVIGLGPYLSSHQSVFFKTENCHWY
jgi:hypothetical protein